MNTEELNHEQESKWKTIKQSLNFDELEQFAILVKPSEDKSLSIIKMDWVVEILKNIKYDQCIIFYNDKGRGDQIVAELK